MSHIEELLDDLDSMVNNERLCTEQDQFEIIANILRLMWEDQNRKHDSETTS